MLLTSTYTVSAVDALVKAAPEEAIIVTNSIVEESVLDLLIVQPRDKGICPVLPAVLCNAQSLP